MILCVCLCVPRGSYAGARPKERQAEKSAFSRKKECKWHAKYAIRKNTSQIFGVTFFLSHKGRGAGMEGLIVNDPDSFLSFFYAGGKILLGACNRERGQLLTPDSRH